MLLDLAAKLASGDDGEPQLPPTFVEALRATATANGLEPSLRANLADAARLDHLKNGRL